MPHGATGISGSPAVRRSRVRALGGRARRAVERGDSATGPEIGLAWEQIGYIISFGLLAYVLLEWPLGVLADRYIGEKEIMAVGFVILAISAAFISAVPGPILLWWMILIFTTRVGAAMVETTTESYFFKHTDGGDADTIGFFRLLRPLANVFGALLGSICLLYLPFELMFIILGFVMVPGIYFTHRLHDTK